MSADGMYEREQSPTASVVNEEQGLPLKRLRKGAGFKNWQHTVSASCTRKTCSRGMLGLTSLANRDKHLAPKHDHLCYPATKVVKIPSKLILDFMLEELSLPKARYDFHVDERGQVSAVVTFYTSTRLPGNLIRPVKLGGAESTDAEIAEESAAKEAIRFVESCEGIEVEDLHFSELKHVNQVHKDLLGKLYSTEYAADGLRRGLCLAARRMIGFSNQINGIATNHFRLQEPATEGDMHELIKMFEGVAFDLGHAGRCLKKNLKKLQKFQHQHT